MLRPSDKVLRGRYTVARIVEVNPVYQLWEARDVFGGPVLVKVWPFLGERPRDDERAVWNLELRHLYRLASLPDADEHLVVLLDAGIDLVGRCFAMAMRSPGSRPLEALLEDRARHDWLKNVATPATRVDLWRAARRLAMGLVQLHGQQMLHRAVSTRCVLVDSDRGPATMRLGGFEWTVRLGGTPPSGFVPTTHTDGAYSFDSDWLLYGVLLARLLAAAPESIDIGTIVQRVQEQTFLTGEERELLERLLSTDRHTRLTFEPEILQRIDQVITLLDEPIIVRPDDYLALVALLGPQRPLTLTIIEEDNTIGALEIERQRQFIEADLQMPRVVRRDGTAKDTYTLIGNRLTLLLTEYAPDGSAGGHWDLAYCGSHTELRSSPGERDQVLLGRPAIRVFTLRSMSTDETVVRRAARPWKAYLPRVDERKLEEDSLQRFHDFFRVTNQLELLMLDAEIFRYSIADSRVIDGAEQITIREESRVREVPRFAKVADGLTGFLMREREDTRDGDLVYLGSEDSLDIGRQVPRTEFWQVMESDPDRGIVTLRRPKRIADIPPSPLGFVRTFGMFGQMSLIKRRKKAIDRLGNHTYLLRSLMTPDFTFIDTGDSDLPIWIDPSRLDDAKQAALRSIWRTRPIFALQGPPGTGKTTLVANLLAQIFKDDPVAQVLVTAQAHAAVDVLRETVANQADTEYNQPLAIRLLRAKGDDSPDRDYVEQVTHRMLAGAVAKLGASDSRTGLQSRWLDAAQETMRALVRRDTEGQASDLCELVRKAASITYCTTTAGNLAELADSTQTFDWSIIEEAGKAHGFDLVLPLQTGHRWLLIGDQRQLSPYRIENFRDALSNLDAALEAVGYLPRRGGGQADIDLSLRWRRYNDSEKASRRQLWKEWLNFFETLHSRCSRAALRDDQEAPEIAGGPVLAEMLWQQHRMHSSISDLVSKAYYQNRLKSKTVDPSGSPLPRVVHPFSAPKEVVGRAIVWLDVPSVDAGGRGEAGSEQTGGRYTSPDELDAIERFLNALEAPGGYPMTLALLSPYRRQVSELNRRFRHWSPPEWLARTHFNVLGGQRPLAHTVDSFQGNQADVIVVSLVRNNDKDAGKGLGFLREARRMNVLFSRAERLLVLVGSWDFFRRQLHGLPADDTQPLGHWRLALDCIDSHIQSGAAAFIPSSSLRHVR